jgi:hypothetical protein
MYGRSSDAALIAKLAHLPELGESARFYFGRRLAKLAGQADVS